VFTATGMTQVYTNALKRINARIKKLTHALTQLKNLMPRQLYKLQNKIQTYSQHCQPVKTQIKNTKFPRFLHTPLQLAKRPDGDNASDCLREVSINW